MIKIIFLSIILLSSFFVGSVNVDVFAQQNNANENSNGKANANELIKTAQTKGKIRIIVELDQSFTPEGYLGNAQEKMIQRAMIRSAQGALLSELPFSEDTKSYKYKFIPFMAMTVNPGVLQHLIDSPMVTSIHEDALEYTTLFESRGIIDVPEAYTLGFTGAGQTVAILDSGVLSSHAFFSGRVVDQACFTNNDAGSGVGSCPNGQSEQFGSPAGEPCAPNDAKDSAKAGCTHGTHVAGIAAGDGTGIMGAPVSGVAKDAKIMAIQVFTTFTAGCMGGPPCIAAFVSDQIKGMEHVLDKHNDPSFTHKIASINMSLGGTQTFSSPCDDNEPARLAAINNLRSVNIATVISSGNDGASGISAPGCISTAITTGATTNSDIVASYSNSASYLDLLAPGGSATEFCEDLIQDTRIVSSFSISTVDDCITQTTPPFGAIFGTSMAAPHVTGAWAVLKEKHPAATVDEILSALQNNGVSIGGFTRIDLDDALNSIMFCGSAESAFNRIDGTAGNDVIGGTSGDDLIFGGAGNDHIQGGAGNDCIFGEGGNDVLSGGTGNDEISGGVDADNINGWAGDDTLFGNAGADVIAGGDDNDTIQGGTGNDHIQGNDGLDIISGNDGDDIISGGAGDDTINGNAGNDVIAGREGDDTIDGGTGSDICQGGGQAGDSTSNCE